jgi:hypothetical protein
VLETAAQVGKLRTAGSHLPITMEGSEDSSGPAGVPGSATGAAAVDANSTASVRDQESGDKPCASRPIAVAPAAQIGDRP